MNSIMKKMMMMAAMAALLFSCGGEEPSLTNSDGSMDIKVSISDASALPDAAKVKAIVTAYDENDEETEVAIAEADWNGGNFTITLPATLDEGLLNAISDISEEYLASGITISDTEARVAFPLLQIFDSEDTYLDMIMQGYFSYSIVPAKAEIVITLYAYLDRKVTIKGSVVLNEEEVAEEEAEPIVMTVNLPLNKGWNVVYAYVKMEQSGTENKAIYSISTKKPSGFTLEWMARDLLAGLLAPAKK